MKRNILIKTLLAAVFFAAGSISAANSQAADTASAEKQQRMEKFEASVRELKENKKPDTRTDEVKAPEKLSAEAQREAMSAPPVPVPMEQLNLD